MPRFYINSILHQDDQLELTDEVFRHIAVLRLKLGQDITLFNGNGSEYLATITLFSKKTVVAKIHQEIKSSKSPKLTIDLLLCIIANDKMDMAIQKAIELGVNSITPVISERSQKLIQEKITKRMEHWQKIVINSCEQCGNNILPEVKTPLILNKALAAPYSGLKLILSPKQQGLATTGNQQSLQLLVGPEGGFSQAEMDTAQNSGFIPVCLGNLVLRSETAVIAGITYAQLKFGGW